MQQNIFANVAGSRRSNNYICNMQHMLCNMALASASTTATILGVKGQDSSPGNWDNALAESKAARAIVLG